MISFEERTLASFQNIPHPFKKESHQYTLEFIKANGCIVLDASENLITVGITKTNDKLLRDLQIFHAEPVKYIKIDHTEFTSYINRLVSSNPQSNNFVEKSASYSHNVDLVTNDAPNINLVNSILIDAYRKKASDIHIESFKDHVSIRYRLDGVLHEMETIDPLRFPGISSRLKIMAGLNIMERRMPQDGRLSIDIENETIDIRISTVPVARGESLVLRIFNKQKEAYELPELGFPDYALSSITSILRSQNGLFLVTGPTGSGKSTTLYAILRALNKPELKIVSIEDPVEQEIVGINQIQVNESIGLGFDVLLKRILRQDPDVIMVGEIRDKDTADIAIRAAMTGHLVLATLHTNDSVSSIHRICNMGIPEYLLAAVLRGVIAQRLVRRLCTKCRIKEKMTMEDIRFSDSNRWEMKSTYHSTGCTSCRGTGYTGRIPIVEVLPVTAQIEEQITLGKSTSELRCFLSTQGMKTLKDDAKEKIIAGVTDIKEVERNIDA